MGISYIWDTNICIYYLQNQFDENVGAFIDNLLIDNIPVISAITEIELLCWKAATEKDIELIHNFINDITVIELEQDIKLKTAEIRKLHNIKLPDAIIAASALTYKLTLITRNSADFKNIPNLQVINPF
jgi:predicted nucleic acid-binding protein